MAQIRDCLSSPADIINAKGGTVENYAERVERETEEDRLRGLLPYYERLWRMGYQWPSKPTKYIGGTSLVAQDRK